ncbi:hypothetical protein [Natrinema versiforme]|uniref:Uncharacterized protein n=1 Tax=Natrinema versiforme JCM 10478 TaxID=1227496 RepID=L9XVJ5_9EURY|nr:hypothetical protein [Natrinema versiforme]ELY65502.1 hypothetical protein C489_14530 [Natrinema versiforme JCM 10478]
MSSHPTNESWFRTQPVLWFLLAIAVPGGVYAGSGIVFGGQSRERAVLIGITFGLVFAVTTAVLKDALGR